MLLRGGGEGAKWVIGGFLMYGGKGFIASDDRGRERGGCDMSWKYYDTKQVRPPMSYVIEFIFILTAREVRTVSGISSKDQDKLLRRSLAHVFRTIQHTCLNPNAMLDTREFLSERSTYQASPASKSNLVNSFPASSTSFFAFIRI